MACFSSALQSVSITDGTRQTLRREVDFYRRRVEEIETDLEIEGLESLLPEAPTTAPLQSRPPAAGYTNKNAASASEAGTYCIS